MAAKGRKATVRVASQGSRASHKPAARGQAAAMVKTNRGPQPIANILAELMARSGLARVQSAAILQNAWEETAGPMAARYTRVGIVRRGKLEVVVANSTFIQELNYQKPAIVEALARLLPDQKIKDVRFRLGPID